MAEQFDDIKFEIYYSGTGWVDVSEDVLANPHPRGAVGILNNGFLDRVQDGNLLTFSLNNSENNSQGTLGYYSTLNPTNLVRLSFQYDNRRKYKFFGYIPPDGVKVTPGVYGSRKVDVTCRDWFGLISTYKIRGLPYTINSRAVAAIPLLLATLPTELQPETSIQAGRTFADLFDLMTSDTTIISELNKMAISEGGYAYLRPREEPTPLMVYESIFGRSAVTSDTSIYKTSSETTSLFLLANGTDRMLLADGSSKLLLTELQTISMGDSDVWMWGGMEINTGDNYANSGRLTLSPRVIDADATSVLWTMESYIEIAAGATEETIIGRYRDPDNRVNRVNCIEGTTPVKNTDFKAWENSDGTGTDLTDYLSVSVTFDTPQVFISLTNTGGTTLYTGGTDILFQLRGRGVKVYDTIDYDLPQTSGFEPYDGISALDFNMPYSTVGIAEGKSFATAMLQHAAERKVMIKKYPLIANRDKKNMMAFMFLEPGNRATFAESVSTYDEESFINGYEFEIMPDKIVAWFPCLARFDYAPV